MAKSDRAILVPEGVVVGKKAFKPGEEVGLADALVEARATAPLVREMADKGFISGDWSKVGLTPDEEADAIAETVEAAKPSAARKGK